MTDKQKEFIKANKGVLESIFNDRIEQLKDSVFNMPDTEERDLEIRFVKEYKEWLRSIGIICSDNKKADTNKIYG
jgi:hypothetical protein